MENGKKRKLKRKVSSQDNASNTKTYEDSDQEELNSYRSVVLKMKVINFKKKLNLIKLQREKISRERQNIKLQIDLLKIRESQLTENISELKDQVLALSKNTKDSASKDNNLMKECKVVINKEILPNREVPPKQKKCLNKEISPNVDISLNKEVMPSKEILKQKKELEDIAVEKIEHSPYVVLMPKYIEDKSFKKFFIGEIFEERINQYFELESEDPFQIHPLDTDVVLKSEYLDMIKEVVLDSFLYVDSENAVPCVSFSSNKQNSENKKGIANTIDLTDNDEHIENNGSVSKKMKCSEDEMNMNKSKICKSNETGIKKYFSNIDSLNNSNLDDSKYIPTIDIE